MHTELQWGGRFGAAPDAALLAFGSSLEDDFALAACDARCSRAHVAALAGGGIVDAATAEILRAALDAVAVEIADGTFAPWARAGAFEDVHGAIDRRVRERCEAAGHAAAGESLHAGRSRNDQVATTLLLYARERAEHGAQTCRAIASDALRRAREELAAGTMLAATTHWQPAQPILLAFWLEAIAEMFARASERFARVATDARRFCPLGSGACSGSSLPLDRTAAARELGFDAPSPNALDSVGDRDVALDLAHAVARALVAASRISEELIVWCTPAFGYARLDDAASTGSSLMPQKRNPSPFELVRGHAHVVGGLLAGALASAAGRALSYHSDFQETKAAVIGATERGLATLDAFARAFGYVHFRRDAMSAAAGNDYTIATDLADALVARGVPARKAHERIGAAVLRAEREGRPLGAGDLRELAEDAGVAPFDGPLDARASIAAKRTDGSTHPDAVARAIERLERELATSATGGIQ